MKRFFDIAVSGILLIIFSPVMIVVFFFVLREFGPPALLRQVRPGKDAKPFEMLKFRTMTDARAPNGALLPDLERLTPFGRFLRSSSLDELPELWNVLKGEMSLVGPRPLLTEYLPLYSVEQARRHEVCPGITGWAQVNGRNAISWTEKFSLDVWYVENQSMLVDLKILWMTIIKVMRREGVTAKNSASAEKFTGNR